MKLVIAGLVGAAVLVGVPAEAVETVTFELPAPTGDHRVGIRTVHLVDEARQDPWKPDRKRELMISVWYPARDAERYPRAAWQTPGAAAFVEEFAARPLIGIPKGSVDWAGAKTAGRSNAPVDRKRRPVVLYSSGFNEPRTFGTTQVQDLASHGYIVVTVDHTFETTVEFPGGRVEPAVPPQQTEEFRKKVIDTRVADTRFVLDRLPQMSREFGMDLSKVGMFGHSFGGYTAGEE